MTSDDLRRIFMGPTLFRLDTVLSPRLIPVLYVTGLATLLMWAVTHLVLAFASSFGDGLWSLLEIVVYGSFGLVVLRTQRRRHRRRAQSKGVRDLAARTMRDAAREALKVFSELTPDR